MNSISTAKDFHAAVAATDEIPLVAYFTAPWCGDCNLVGPKVEKLAEELRGSAVFNLVSADELETLCEEVEVDNFPHFRVYKAGKTLGDHTGSKFDKIEAFIRGLVASDRVGETEDTPEGDTAVETSSATKTFSSEAKTEGLKKRKERDVTEAQDEQVAKKVKIEEEALKETEQAVSNAEASVVAATIEIADNENADVVDLASGMTENAGEVLHESVIEDNAELAQKLAKEAETTRVDVVAA
ncbi:hypothetical protein CCR75_005426 [Bremia lactucae]|uniref:Thioredoxin domain-containing protein n=1 Tax=Bremia lactucae TaxID=4779 RepID=A0A976FKC0_BRELC|nr:hypothetical protein CCR75_005426 [Bremia lactucae]